MKFAHNSTIAKREKICKSCGKPCYWFSKQRCQSCSTQQDTLKRMEKETEKMIEEEDLSGLIADADAIFSKYIRLRYADRFGDVACYTCGTRKHWTLMQNGHFVGRANLYLRHDERNCRPQDADCNEKLHGNMAVFSQRLDKECKGLPDLLRSEARLIHKPTREEIRAIITEYTPKVKQLLHTLKMNNP